LRRHAIVAARLVAALVLLCSLASCTTHHDPDYSLDLNDVTVGGPGTVGLSVVGEPVKAIVVYFHGADQTARVIRDSEKHRNVFDPLLRSGMAIVAADAGGDAYGNPASREDYLRLIADAREKYGQVPLFFVAESMGALAALALINEDTHHDVKAMVGITPLMGLPPDIRTVSFIEGPWEGSVPSEADPLSWPPDAFEGRSFRLYASPGDKVIPSSASAFAFANRFGSVARVDVLECQGGHVASDCYRGSDVAAWFTSLG
jgi:pimeloyl-ACP methyl ester carboxylesterase